MPQYDHATRCLLNEVHKSIGYKPGSNFKNHLSHDAHVKDEKADSP